MICLLKPADVEITRFMYLKWVPWLLAGNFFCVNNYYIYFLSLVALLMNRDLFIVYFIIEMTSGTKYRHDLT